MNNNNNDEIIMFNSMLELTDFILYDNNQDECIFSHINETEINEIKLICNELDLLYDDLNEINAKLIKYKQSYRIYCDNLLKLCDDKDKLVEMFLDYYNEYIESNTNIKTTKSKNNKKTKTSSSSYSYAVPVENRFGILSIKNKK